MIGGVIWSTIIYLGCGGVSRSTKYRRKYAGKVKVNLKKYLKVQYFVTFRPCLPVSWMGGDGGLFKLEQRGVQWSTVFVWKALTHVHHWRLSHETQESLFCQGKKHL